MSISLRNSSLIKPRFCVSIAESSTTKLNSTVKRAFVSGSHFAEIRLDCLSSFSIEKIQNLSNTYKNRLILTFRSKNEGGFSNISESDRLDILSQLLDLKYSIKDIEFSTYLKHYSLFQKKKNLLISWHNFKSTPSYNELETRVRTISKKLSNNPENNGNWQHGKIIKIVTKANTMDDCNKIFKLYKKFNKSRFHLLAFCMGDNGSATRILSPFLGAPFVYCFIGKNPIAPGQIHINTLKEIYSNF